MDKISVEVDKISASIPAINTFTKPRQGFYFADSLGESHIITRTRRFLDALWDNELMDSTPSRAHILESDSTSTPNTATTDSNSVVPKHVESISPSLAPVASSHSHASNEAKSAVIKKRKSGKGYKGGTPTEARPERMRQAVSYLVQAVGSTVKAGALLGLPDRTVREMVNTRASSDLPAIKKTLACKAAVVCEDALELTANNMHKVRSVMESATIAGIMADKVAKLTEDSQSAAPQLNMLLQVLTARPQAPDSVSDATVVDVETKE